MQRRKTRKGFWWWTWLLVLFTAGGTIGGWFVGQKLWEKAPKDYVSSAVLKVDIVPPYIDSKATKSFEGIGGVLNDEELKVLKSLDSISFLTIMGEHYNLWERWGVDQNEGIKKLRDALQFDLNENRELSIQATQHSPEDALELAKFAVETAVPGLEQLAEARKAEGLAAMEADLEVAQQQADDATAELAAAIKVMGATVEPREGMNLDPYMIEPSVLQARVAWDSALGYLKERKRALLPMKMHWERKVKTAMVVEAPELPMRISGPQKEPFQTRGAVAGVSLGIIFGLLSMLMCWKLFS
ncbi:hypothetical protein N9Z02_02865 [Akkermansiaceae bacterium]|nr:hypothetical protein [Akkermansiaceae bacterium]